MKLQTHRYLTYYGMADDLYQAMWILKKTRAAPISAAEQQVIDFALDYIEKRMVEFIHTGDLERARLASQPTREDGPPTDDIPGVVYSRPSGGAESAGNSD